ncbi:MAG: hypothetical protein WC627_07310 [Legionella sp.]|jgi:hypothetical protein
MSLSYAEYQQRAQFILNKLTPLNIIDPKGTVILGKEQAEEDPNLFLCFVNTEFAHLFLKAMKSLNIQQPIIRIPGSKQTAVSLEEGIFDNNTADRVFTQLAEEIVAVAKTRVSNQKEELRNKLDQITNISDDVRARVQEHLRTIQENMGTIQNVAKVAIFTQQMDKLVTVFNSTKPNALTVYINQIAPIPANSTRKYISYDLYLARTKFLTDRLMPLHVLNSYNPVGERQAATDPTLFLIFKETIFSIIFVKLMNKLDISMGQHALFPIGRHISVNIQSGIYEQKKLDEAFADFAKEVYPLIDKKELLDNTTTNTL